MLNTAEQLQPIPDCRIIPYCNDFLYFSCHFPAYSSFISSHTWSHLSFFGYTLQGLSTPLPLPLHLFGPGLLLTYLSCLFLTQEPMQTTTTM